MSKYTEELKKFSRTYRQTHTQLKRLCDPDDYTRLYGHYDKDLEKIRTWFKAATARETELTADLLRRVERKEREEKEEKAEKARKLEEKERKEREEKEEEKAEKA